MKILNQLVTLKFPCNINLVLSGLQFYQQMASSLVVFEAQGTRFSQ